MAYRPENYLLTEREMNKSFFLDEVALNSNNSPKSIWERIRLAWKVLRGGPLTLSNALRVSLDGNCGLTAEMWVKPPDVEWQHRGVTFDGTTAIGYVNGEAV
jgi:hypothetical protein